MERYGLTGGIASGKSTVARMLGHHGVPIVDADLIYHGLIAPINNAQGPSPLALQVAQAFGDVLLADHTLNRQALAARIFADASARQTLEAITHPAVHREAERQMAAYALAHHSFIFYDVPLLFERNMQQQFKAVVLVFVPPALQLQRLLQRDGATEDAARARLASQMSLTQKVPLSHYVINNSQSIEHTAQQVTLLLQTLGQTATF